MIPAVTSAWTKAPAETIASTGTMTSRPIPVHSFGTEAVVEMTTVIKQRMNARRLVLYTEQVTLVDFQQQICTLFYFYFFLNIILFCPQQDKRRRNHQKVDFPTLQSADFSF